MKPKKLDVYLGEIRENDAANLTPDDIPSLDASKIASGTLAAARIPSLDASKIASGTLEIDAAAMEMLNVGAATITEAEMQELHANEISATALTAGSASFGDESNTAIIKIGGGTRTSVIGGTFATIGSDSGYGCGRIVIGVGTNASYGYGYLDVGKRYGVVTVGGMYGTITVGGGLKTVIRHDAITSGDGTFSRNLVAGAGTFSALYGNFVLDASKIASGTLSEDRLPSSGLVALKALSETYDSSKGYCLLDFYSNRSAKIMGIYVTGLTNANISMRIADDLGLASGVQYISQESVCNLPNLEYDDGHYSFQFAGIQWCESISRWKEVYSRPINVANISAGFYFLYFLQDENRWVIASNPGTGKFFSGSTVVAKAPENSGMMDSYPYEGEYSAYGSDGVAFSLQKHESEVPSSYGDLEGCYIYTGASNVLVHKALNYDQEDSYYDYPYVSSGYTVFDPSGAVATYDLVNATGMSPDIVLGAEALCYKSSGYPTYANEKTFYEVRIWIDNPSRESVTISPAAYNESDKNTPNKLIWKEGDAPDLKDERIGLLLRAEISDKYWGDGWYHADLYVSRIY